MVEGALEEGSQGGHHLANRGGARGQDVPAHLLYSPEESLIGGKGRSTEP